MNDVHMCDREGGYTPFDCDMTAALQSGSNFVVVAVTTPGRANAVLALKADWWNYGGLTRQVYSSTSPQSYIDDYSLQLKRGPGDQIEGYVRVVGASTRTTSHCAYPS